MGNGINSLNNLITPGAPFAATPANGIKNDNVGEVLRGTPGLRGFAITGKIYEEAFNGDVGALTIFLGGPMIQHDKYSELYNDDEFKQNLGVSKKEFNEASFLKRMGICWLGN